MVEIRTSWRDRALQELRSIADRHEGDFGSQNIDWRVIETQLTRLDAAYTQGNGSEFNAALEMLVGRLGPPIVFRGEIGPAKSAKMPQPVFELLNHIVHRLDDSEASPSDLKGDDAGDQPASVVPPATGETDVC